MSDQKKPDSIDKNFDIGLFRPDDAEGITSLFRAVYGEEYPIKIFYDPKALTEANMTGQLYSIVARESSGKIVGIDNLFRSAPYEGIYEIGAGLVLKEFRKLGLSHRMIGFLCDEFCVDQEGVEEVFGEPVCNHLTMQKMVGRMKTLETGLEVALMPGKSFARESGTVGRVSVLLVFRCYKSLPHTVFIPKCYENEIKFMYSDIDDTRTFITCSEESLSDEITQSRISLFDFAQVARIAINIVGYDFDDHFEKVERQAIGQGVVVLQAWLPIGNKYVNHAVNVLRSRGYFLGGVLPRWFNEDGILMQKVLVDPCFEGIQLYSDRSKKILEIIKLDWKRVAV
jgi:hypothetical protein